MKITKPKEPERPKSAKPKSPPKKEKPKQEPKKEEEEGFLAAMVKRFTSQKD